MKECFLDLKAKKVEILLMIISEKGLSKYVTLEATPFPLPSLLS